MSFTQRASEQFNYNDHERQRLSCYDHTPNSDKTPLIFIHGGAWRDPRNSNNDANGLATYLPHDVPLFSIDYRLSPEVKHPKHNQDVLSAIQFILKAYPYEKIKLAGHSVGATIILSILSKLKHIVDEVFLIDGIYDLKELVTEYPSYETFVADAHEDYKVVKPLQLSDYGDYIRFNIIYSYKDELLSIKQTKWLINQLESKKFPYTLHVSDLGEHEEVYRHPELAKIINSTY